MPSTSKKIVHGTDYSEYLEGYTERKGQSLENVKPGDKIRYLSDNSFKKGGIVKINKWPQYIVCLNPTNKATWCVQLNIPDLKIWTKSMEDQSKELQKMREVYKLYREGKLVLKKNE